MFLDNQGRQIHKNLHYFPIYERHFQRYVGRPLLFLEIGAGRGGSAQMWRRYFGPFCKIVCLDVRPECAAYEDQQISVRIGDQSDSAFLEDVLAEFGTPDIVLDDGSHMMSHVQASFDFLYPRVSSSGVYFVEDLHTAYWPQYEGGLRRKGTFWENCKELTDELNWRYTSGVLPETPFARTTISMHFYDSIVVFERGQYVTTESIQIGS